MTQDIPVSFSRPMVRALLDDRKTMTRRLAWREEKVGSGRKPSYWSRVQVGDRLWVRESLTCSGDGIWCRDADNCRQ